MSKLSVPVRKFDAVIVGAGGSGLRAAIQLSEAGLKTAVLSNGAKTMVPPHIGVGTRVVVMTEDGSYVERAKD